jgi:hypothetical protein
MTANNTTGQQSNLTLRIKQTIIHLHCNHIILLCQSNSRAPIETKIKTQPKVSKMIHIKIKLLEFTEPNYHAVLTKA